MLTILCFTKLKSYIILLEMQFSMALYVVSFHLYIHVCEAMDRLNRRFSMNMSSDVEPIHPRQIENQ